MNYNGPIYLLKQLCQDFIHVIEVLNQKSVMKIFDYYIYTYTTQTYWEHMRQDL